MTFRTFRSSKNRLNFNLFFTFPANHKSIIIEIPLTLNTKPLLCHLQFATSTFHNPPSSIQTFPLAPRPIPLYNKIMFTQNKCLVHYCRNLALSAIDENGEISDKKNYCLDHIPDPGKVKDDIYKYIEEHEKIVGLNACGLLFKNLDFSGKKFFGCNFTHCTFINVHSDKLLFRMCLFDFALFNDCNFIHSNTLFTSFSGATFTHTLFTSSDMVQNNFNGIRSFQSSFDDSDLFNSRFISGTLVDTSFRNCNLKKTQFQNTTRKNVSFKMSNTREAIFTKDGSLLSQGDTQFGNSIVDGAIV